MLQKLYSPRIRWIALFTLGLVLAISGGRQNTQAAGGFNAALLPDHRAQAAYERLVHPWQSTQRIQAAFAKRQNLAKAQVLPPALNSHVVASSSTTGNLSWSNGNLSPAGAWTSVGPAPLDTSQESSGPVNGPNGGRVTSIAVWPGASGANSVIYIGTMGGGVWVSGNNGASWVP